MMLRLKLCYNLIAKFQKLKINGIILSVLFNLFLTLTIWIFVYSMETDKRLINSMFFDSNKENDYNVIDASISGLRALLSIIIGAIIVVILVYLNFRKVINFWLYSGSVLILFGSSGNLIYDIMMLTNISNSSYISHIVTILTSIYGCIGSCAYFTRILPNYVLQFYILCNASLVSIIYLRSTPTYASWFLLFLVPVWDMFAVWSSFGPLHLLQHKAEDYSDDHIRILMYASESSEETEEQPYINIEHMEMNASDEQRKSVNMEQMNFKTMTKHGKEWEEDILDDEMASNENEVNQLIYPEKKRLDCNEESNTVRYRTAAEALNDGSQRLGVGDYVFYGVLVGTSATSGSILATLTTCIGIIVGLSCTLCYASDNSDTTPALPLSIYLGASGHFFVIGVEKLLFHILSNNGFNDNLRIFHHVIAEYLNNNYL